MRPQCESLAPADHDLTLPNGRVIPARCQGPAGHEGVHYNGTHEWTAEHPEDPYVFWTTRCIVRGCTAEPHPQVCPGDHRYHHHGGVHLAPGTSLDTLPGWGWLCHDHAAQAKGEWAAIRVLRAAERGRQ